MTSNKKKMNINSLCLMILLMLSTYKMCMSQQQHQKESEYKNFQSFTFPDYFEIRYPADWKKSDSDRIAFSCKHDINGRTVAIITGRVIKQVSFQKYLKSIWDLYFTNAIGLAFSKTVSGKKAVYFTTPVYQGVGERHLLIAYDDNTTIHFAFQFPVNSNERISTREIEKSIKLMGAGISESIEENKPRVEFVDMNVAADSALSTGWYFISENEGIKRTLDYTSISYFVNPMPIVTSTNVRSHKVERNHLFRWSLFMMFDDTGTKAWAVATAKATGKKVGFVFKNHLMYVAEVSSAITIGVSSMDSEFYTKDELQAISEDIEKERRGQ